MIVNLINSTSWPAPPTATSSRAPSVPSAPPSRSTSIDPNSAALEDILVGGEEGAAPQAVSSVNRPQWRTGPSMQETAIGSIKLKVGEPYWYMHQGNAEHVWTVDSIRYVASSVVASFLYHRPPDSSLTTLPKTQSHPFLGSTLQLPSLPHHILSLSFKRSEMSSLRSRSR